MSLLALLASFSYTQRRSIEEIFVSGDVLQRIPCWRLED
jgi:hypothetical protein